MVELRGIIPFPHHGWWGHVERRAQLYRRFKYSEMSLKEYIKKIEGDDLLQHLNDQRWVRIQI